MHIAKSKITTQYVRVRLAMWEMLTRDADCHHLLPLLHPFELTLAVRRLAVHTANAENNLVAQVCCIFTFYLVLNPNVRFMYIINLLSFYPLIVCTCLPTYVGSPPNCRPECVANSDCPQHLACRNQRCTDPCPGTCGYLAECKVVQHNAICSCIAGHTGK